MNPRIILRAVVYTVGVVSPVDPTCIGIETPANPLAKPILLTFMGFWLIIAVICLIDILRGVILRFVLKKVPQKRKLLWNSTFWILIALLMLFLAIVIGNALPYWFDGGSSCALT